MQKMLVGLLSVVLLTSCATMSVEECKVADWRSVGYKDGTNGQGSDYLMQHGKACAKGNIFPDRAAWELGRKEGLKMYCTPSNAYNLGLAGKHVNPVCPVILTNSLDRQNRKGLLRHDITKAQNQIDKLREDRNKYYSGSNLGYKNRDEARKYVATIDDKIYGLQRKIYDLRSELYALN